MNNTAPNLATTLSQSLPDATSCRCHAYFDRPMDPATIPTLRISIGRWRRNVLQILLVVSHFFADLPPRVSEPTPDCHMRLLIASNDRLREFRLLNYICCYPYFPSPWQGVVHSDLAGILKAMGHSDASHRMKYVVISYIYLHSKVYDIHHGRRC
jgi:hypothetical protein